MLRSPALTLLNTALLLSVAIGSASAATNLNAPSATAAFYDRVRPALVAVKYQWQRELQRIDIVGSGVVVRSDGLVMIPELMVADGIPDSQMKDFKIVVPSDTADPDEVPAVFVGRDPRADVAFVKPAKDSRKWTAIQFVDEPDQVGERLFSLGLLSKDAGYKAFLTEATVAANLRGEEPQILVSGSLATVGGVVFDSSAQAIGWIAPQNGQESFVESSGNPWVNVLVPPRFFIPTRFFQISLDHPPTAGQPLKIPWLGLGPMTGISKDLADFLGLKNQPAVQIGDVIEDGPSATGGLKPSDIIIAMNGKPLGRGDLPDEIPQILARQIMRMKVGDKVTFTVMTQRGLPTRQVTVTLGQRPPSISVARRYYASDLGFVAREAMFQDKYEHKISLTDPAVVIDLVKPDGAAANARLAQSDLILQLNGSPVTDLDDFENTYKSFRANHPHDAVVLVVQEPNGQEETLNIEPPEDAAGGAAPGVGGP